MIRKIVKPKIIIQILFFIFPHLSILQQHLLKRCSSLYNLFILLAINEQIWKNAQMNRDIPTWWMVQWSWTKTHPTTTANGDVSCLQCKAVRRNLQDLKRITAREYFSDVYLEHVKTLTHSVFMLGYKGKVVNAEVFCEKHRTTVAHFLNNGRWDSLLEA